MTSLPAFEVAQKSAELESILRSLGLHPPQNEDILVASLRPLVQAANSTPPSSPCHSLHSL